MEILKDQKRTNPFITFHEAGRSSNVKRTTTRTTNKQINKPDQANLGKIALIDLQHFVKVMYMYERTSYKHV